MLLNMVRILSSPSGDPQVIVADVQEDLGLTGQQLAAQLYKLLLYDEGSFFLPHCDGRSSTGRLWAVPQNPW
jgi:hypothetical protein